MFIVLQNLTAQVPEAPFSKIWKEIHCYLKTMLTKPIKSAQFG